MSIGRVASTAGTVAVLALLSTPVTASAAGELDQKQEELGSGGAIVSSSFSWAQTFKAGKSGTLDKVELFLSQAEIGETPTAPLTVEITEVNASGEPETTNVLGSGSFGPQALPPFPAGEWVSINVSAPSTAGSEYAIVAFSSSPQEYIWTLSEAINPYAGGESWVSRSSPPAAWGRETEQDLTFRTYVEPPLPATEDQCKDGGWKNFGSTFKNQGQCVSFVEHELHAAR